MLAPIDFKTYRDMIDIWQSKTILVILPQLKNKRWDWLILMVHRILLGHKSALEQ
jgi:hypothetical protein